MADPRPSPWPRRAASILLAASLLPIGGAPASGPPQVPTTTPAPADPLVALNDRFHDAYRRARGDELAGAGPVILVSTGAVILVRGEQRAEVPFPPPAYHRLKEVAHVPLLVFVLLKGAGGRPLDPDRLAEASRGLGLVDASLAKLDPSAFPAGSVDRQRAILGTTRAYLAGVIEAGRAEPGALAEYAQAMGPLMLANADDAAKVHLEALDAQVQAWRRSMTEQERRSMRAVVMSAHMARDREIAMQYFEKLLGESAEGHRIVYAEGIVDPGKALDLLGTHLLDGSASLAFFGDERRLHRDILSDGGTKALESMTIRP